MKNLYAAGALCLLLFTAFTSYAQVEPPFNQQLLDKPTLFSSLPDKFVSDHSELEKLFSLSPADKCQVKLNTQLALNGIVLEKIKRNEQVTSINIRVNGYSNALFNLSRVELKGDVNYIGRIVSPGHADLLLLKKEGRKYYWVKQEQRFSMVE